VNKTDKTSIFRTSLLVALMGATFGAQAAGLGKLMVYSAIGQPLNAEVAVTAAPDELVGLSARLAPHKAFQEAGIDFPPVLTALRFNLAKAPDGRPVLRLSTDAPINEPFLHFLVELNWTSGRMVREYTFLLDPPEMLQVAKPASVVSPVEPPIQQSVAPLAPVKAVPSAPAPSAAPAVTDGVRVKPGDTLSKIAREHKPEAVTLDQMLVALFNRNREVFDGDNMNRLRAGKILRLPDPAEVAGVDAGEARKLIVSQAADFSAYRRRLAEAVATAPVVEAMPRQEIAGKITPEVEDKAPPAPDRDKLEVSRTEAVKSGSGDRARLEEDLVARDKALREAAERIAQLEKNLENLKSLVELKSQGGAELQQQAAVAAPKPAEEPKPVPGPTEPVDAESAPPAAPPAAAQVPEDKPAEPAAASVEPVKTEAPPVPVASEQPAKPAAKPAVKRPVAPPPPPPEPSFIEENTELVFGGGGLIALLLGYFGYNAWRRKKQAAEAAELEEISDELAASEGPPSMDGGDDGEVSIQSDFSEGGAFTTEESVDPVAEADVLMAYGRDTQAEEILKEGLKTDPARAAIHLKLLEIYANRKDAGQFEAAARSLHELNQGQGPEWSKAVLMAGALGVANDLFPTTSDIPVETASEENVEESSLERDLQAEATVEPAAEVKPEEVEVEAAASEEIAVSVADSEAASLDFDLDLGTTSGPAVAMAEEEARAKAEHAAEEAASLDFDFDLGSPSEPEPEAVVAPAGPEMPIAAGDDNAIDFSVDLGVDSEPQADADAAAPVAEEKVEDSGGIDFSLDIGSAEERATDEPEAAVQAVSGDESNELGVDFDLDLDAGEPPAVGAMNAETDASAQSGEIALPEIGLDLDEPETAEPPSPLDIPDLDLSLDTELPAAEEAGSPELPEIPLDIGSADESEPAVAEPPSPVESAIPDDPEVATKLELAQAYEEMGDREGARELLNEVLNEGSPAQQAQARTRLDQLEA
jgi:pilus assembly protein FimV